MNNFLRKGWYLVLVLTFVSIAIAIIQKISGGAPVFFGDNVIVETIFWLDGIITAWLFLSMPRTGVVGDERTKRALEKASLYAFLILVGCLILLSGAYILGGINSFLLAIKDSPWTPIIVAHIGIYSWAILVYYFVKKGDV